MLIHSYWLRVSDVSLHSQRDFPSQMTSPMLKSLPPCTPRQLLLEQALTPRLNKDLLHKPSKKKLWLFSVWQKSVVASKHFSFSQSLNNFSTMIWRNPVLTKAQSPSLSKRRTLSGSTVKAGDWVQLSLLVKHCYPLFLPLVCLFQMLTPEKSSHALSWAKTYKEQPHLDRVMQSLSLQGPKFKELLKLMRLFFLKGET